jgi:small subunit ribosomal protein S8
MNLTLINFITKLKNASISKKETINISYTSINYKVTKILYREGFIQSYSLEKKSDVSLTIIIKLRYFYNKSLLKNLRILSKPSSITFLKLSYIIRLKDKKFVFFFSTNKGVLTNIDCKKHKLGGKLLFMC